MTIASYITFIEDAVATQKSAVRIHIALAIVSVTVGGIAIPLDMLPEGTNNLYQTLGGAFIGTLSAFPVREMLSKRDKIAVQAAQRPN